MISGVDQHITVAERRCDLTASVDPAPMVMIDSHISVWRSRDSRENRPFCKFLDSASLGRVNDPRANKPKEKDERRHTVRWRILAWLEIKPYRIQEDRPEGARGVIKPSRHR
jgi:hypothetical protein